MTTGHLTEIFGKLFHPQSVWKWYGTWCLNFKPGKNSMAINQDFRDLFAALNDANAKYLMVGGYAIAFHAQPRFTKDLDIGSKPVQTTQVAFLIDVQLLEQYS